MCDSCFNQKLNRRKFINFTLKSAGTASLVLGASPTWGGEFIKSAAPYPPAGSRDPIPKKPARVMAAFLYPPADVVTEGKNEDNWAQHNWFTWPGNQFKPEEQEKLFTEIIKEKAGKLGVEILFETKAIYQKEKVEEFIRKVRLEKPDAVLVVNFWNTFAEWSYRMAVETGAPAIVYQPVGSNHQLPHKQLMETKGIYFIHSIENWDEIERGLSAVRAKKMLSQSRLLRVSDQDKPLSESRDELLGLEILGVSANEFNDLFDAVSPDEKLLKEALAIKNNATEVMEVRDLYFIEAMRSHQAVGQIMQRYGADAITIQCLMLKHRKPCISFSLNNSNLIPCGCENHLDGTITQMLGRWLFERAGFMHNPEFDINENRYFGAHCTCALKLHGPGGPDQDYLIRPFFHQLPKTAALDVQWNSDEPVLLTKYYSGANKLCCWTGKVIGSPKSPPTGGCATRVLVEMDKVENITDIYTGTHPILYCGTRSDARKIKAFSKLYGLELAGNI